MQEPLLAERLSPKLPSRHSLYTQQQTPPMCTKGTQIHGQSSSLCTLHTDMKSIRKNGVTKKKEEEEKRITRSSIDLARPGDAEQKFSFWRVKGGHKKTIHSSFQSHCPCCNRCVNIILHNTLAYASLASHSLSRLEHTGQTKSNFEERISSAIAVIRHHFSISTSFLLLLLLFSKPRASLSLCCSLFASLVGTVGAILLSQPKFILVLVLRPNGSIPNCWFPVCFLHLFSETI